MIVEALNSMVYFGMVRVVEVFYLSVDLTGFHHHNLFCVGFLDMTALMLVYVVQWKSWS